jgi:hypothetical protein
LVLPDSAFAARLPLPITPIAEFVSKLAALRTGWTPTVYEGSVTANVLVPRRVVKGHAPLAAEERAYQVDVRVVGPIHWMLSTIPPEERMLPRMLGLGFSFFFRGRGRGEGQRPFGPSADAIKEEKKDSLGRSRAPKVLGTGERGARA